MTAKTADTLQLAESLASAGEVPEMPELQSAWVSTPRFHPAHAADVMVGQQTVPDRGLDQPIELAAEILLLQCDLREVLTSALLAADLLRKHADPMVVKRAETVICGIMRAVDRVG